MTPAKRLLEQKSPTLPTVVGPQADGAQKWTVMVFMGADTIDGNEPLDDAAEADLDEIRSIVTKRTKNGEDKNGIINVFVQVHHSRNGTQRYRFGFDEKGNPTETREDIDPKERGKALTDFIEWSITESGHQRPDYSMLVLWGHAYDFAFARSRTREGVVDAIDFIELSSLLEHLQERIKDWFKITYGDDSSVRPKLDIIGFDACDIATVEMACELEPFADYLLGSEIGIPIPGWPYDRILDRLRNPKDKVMTASEFGSYVVRRFCESYPASSPVSLTFLDLEKAPQLRSYADTLALALSLAIRDSGNRSLIMELFIRSRTGEDRPYVDVADLCLNLVLESQDSLIAGAAKSLGDLLLAPKPQLVGLSGQGTGRPFIVDHGRNAGELARLNGISLYAPHVAPANDFDAVRTLYNGFVFSRKTVWSGLVHALAEQT